VRDAARAGDRARAAWGILRDPSPPRRGHQDGRLRRLENAAFLVCLIVFYGAGSAVLQGAFQHGGALTTAALDADDERAADRGGNGALPRTAAVRVERRRSDHRIRGSRRRASHLATRGKETEPGPRGQDVVLAK
jgi:hypothetical protein